MKIKHFFYKKLCIRNGFILYLQEVHGTHMDRNVKLKDLYLYYVCIYGDSCLCQTTNETAKKNTYTQCVMGKIVFLSNFEQCTSKFVHVCAVKVS